jgi:Secretion system C-terminal sorting domain/Electron transfer DM13
MKTFFFCLGFFGLSLLNAQTCSRTTGNFLMVPGGYVINGTSTVSKNLSNNQLSLSLTSNFSTQSGPDLYVYLAKNLDSPVAAGNEYYEVAKLSAASGAQSYNFSNVPLEKYRYVLIHCKQFNHLWGGALLGAATGTCNTVATETPETTETEFSVYPNPVSNQVFVLSHSTNATEAILYDALGKTVAQFPVSSNTQDIQLSNLPKGMYWLQLGRFSKAIVIH